jgi:2,3-diaminopropionate biosynthesis protein SbnA
MHSGILSTIGHTPLVELKKLYPNLAVKVHAKLEMVNPGGSIKDRPAWLMLSKALEEGKLKKGATVIESSSGNMAIGLAQACRYLNLNLMVVVDPKINNHTRQILQAYGAGIETVTEADAHDNYLNARLNRIQELLDSIPDSYWPNQYANKNNPAAHYHTMQEIVHALPQPPDYLLVATSTCGTIMGCANYLRHHQLNTKIVAVDAVGSVIFGTSAADRLVPGHGAGRPSDLLDKDAVDDVLHITDEECVTGCRRLLQREAILAGGSSGAVVMAIEKMESKIPAGSTCALILPDSGERYLDTIFNDDWVAEHFGTSKAVNAVDEKKIKFSINGSSPVKDEPPAKNGQRTKPVKIAIIGGGPKGMYGFERLAAQFNAHPSDVPVEIHMYNKNSDFGAGDIYRPGQPSCLLMNNQAGDINMWMDEAPRPVVSEPRGLPEWLRQNHGINITESDYVSRSTVGKYLTHGFEQIATHLPENICGQYLIGEVIDIFEAEGNYKLTLKTTDGSTNNIHHRYDYLLLATGHPRNRPTEQDMEFEQFAEDPKDTGFIPFIYPVESMLSNISPGCSVAIKGIGLTFVDAVLAMTEGRGGRFKRQPKNDRLIYKHSGNEPEVIYPFSRSGLPMLPRGPVPQDAPPLIFFTEAALNNMRGKQPDRKLDFKTEMLPLLKQEMTAAFYDIKLKQTGFKEDLSSCRNFAEVKHHIESFHQQNKNCEPFDFENFLAPLGEKQFSKSRAFHSFIQSYWHFYLEEAKNGELVSPWAAVTAVWRKATPLFGKYYAFGGLTPESQHYFDTKFRRKLNRVTFGPPIESVEKLLALMEAGILNLELAKNPIVRANQSNDMFKLEINDFKVRQYAQYLVDARISKVSLPDDGSPLYQNLLNSGIIRMFKNESQHHSYQPGCLEISPNGFVIDKNGTANKQIAATGTPTEGITFDNDALSRSRNNFVSGWAAFIRESLTKSTVDTHVS